MQNNDVISYPVAEAVRVSGLARTRLFEAMRDGRLPFFKVGRRTLILRDDLVAFIKQASPSTSREVR